MVGVRQRGVKDDDSVHTKDGANRKTSNTEPTGRRAPREEEGEHPLQSLI